MMKSHPGTRQILKKRLLEALKSHPGEHSIIRVLDMIDDLDAYDSYANLNGVMVVAKGGKICFVHPSTLTELGEIDNDTDYTDLGIMVKAHL